MLEKLSALENNRSKGSSFTIHLYDVIGASQLGYGTALTALQAGDVMQTYLANERGISISCWKVALVNKNAVIQQLQEKRPVIYADRWNNPQGSGTVDHSIVIYGYNTSTNELIAHFGWAGYSQVVCSSPALAAFVSTACAISSY